MHQVHSLADADVAAALHTLSQLRHLLDRYEAALTAPVRPKSYGISGAGPLYRRALNFSYATLAEAFGRELAAVPVGPPPAPPPPPPPPATAPAERWVVDEGRIMNRSRPGAA
jgi:hypothetical protein